MKLRDKKITRAFEFRSRDEGVIDAIRQELKARLLQQGQDSIYHIVETALSELIQNAFKANLKRIYFTHNSLDLVKDEQKGAAGFREMIQEDPESLLELAKESKHFVRVDFLKENDLTIHVYNSAAITRSELGRAKKLLARKTIAIDESGELAEGAGMGLSMTTRLLGGIGFQKSIAINAADGTTFALRIPRPIGKKHPHLKKLKSFLEKSFPLPVLPEIASRMDQIKGDLRALRSLRYQDPGLFLNTTQNRKWRSRKNATVTSISADARSIATKSVRLARICKELAIERKIAPDRACAAGLLDSLGLYFIYTLSPARLGELRRITGRIKPSPGAALLESTIGASHETIRDLLIDLSGIRKPGCANLVAEARRRIEND